MSYTPQNMQGIKGFTHTKILLFSEHFCCCVALSQSMHKTVADASCDNADVLFWCTINMVHNNSLHCIIYFIHSYPKGVQFQCLLLNRIWAQIQH